MEPNSSLGKAIAYMQGHWDTLTRFLSVPSAPLDNNVVERALLFIRQRKNRCSHKTEYSAYIASVLTSLDCHLSPGRCQRPGIPRGVAGASRRGLCGPGGTVALELPGQSSPTLGHTTPIAGHVGSLRNPAVPEHNDELTSGQGTRASALVGHHVKRPWESRFIMIQYPWPS